ncbi:hypothetical protein KAFR_0B04760 [Kazachstania africana CBS 2517]|uniref:Peptide chain release factor 1, mitochondrial n=1 Tax=Kazachstania africana (strain ATCC 22294 / BCRC 22015 / CBS 2517 / CECT 1963 / NBRC 1671 / NRRL Y-8276) TaxID=1071382 RepID=H2AQX3_KAZAF|nr:hypothetical protein KAFR_0B04760 [Kazachstania africana CBS 2517]CCF56773.1 hypothetical protein KAFR_0B04760 [Kazachstania africana CBS 2517]
MSFQVLKKLTFIRSSFLLRFQSTINVIDKGTLKQLPPSLLEKAKDYTIKLYALDDLISNGTILEHEQQKLYTRLKSINTSLLQYEKCIYEFGELNLLMKDPSLKQEAEVELNNLVPKLNKNSEDLLRKLLPRHPFADKSCLIELRPGVGGIEAMIFTQDLSNMYINYAHKHGWPCSIVSQQENVSGSGLISSILSIDEPGSFDKLKYEAGVHRVQRIPATETKGRTHTSTAGVVVLPQMDNDVDVEAQERKFKPGEIRIDIKRASGKGGQHVNTTDSAVRITHIPTNIVVHMQDERSQHKNKAKAFTILRARIAELENKQREDKERERRKEQVTSTDRSDKIRTYNYPQNRITDHRCGLTMHDIASVMSGERLDVIIDAMESREIELQSKRLLESK